MPNRSRTSVEMASFPYAPPSKNEKSRERLFFLSLSVSVFFTFLFMIPVRLAISQDPFYKNNEDDHCIKKELSPSDLTGMIYQILNSSIHY